MKNDLFLEQLDRKIKSYNRLASITPPPQGWLRSARMALGMSLEQLAKKLAVSQVTLAEIEKRELEGNINISTFKKVAEALNLNLVYGLAAPKGSLDRIIKKQARQVATEIVKRADKTMSLEDQANSRERIRRVIKKRAERLISKREKCLWD